ncbi:MAG: hypothetical protein IPH07_02485 [Deltaproteobacteria bacterium]|nr:hypothetical protein [Deltaproteobacteria bacterium]MBK8718534.1 hypothetical protein [Deltaproteobacteria bacterium]MBP7288596.1 hypothetical protein [Nannocystaceae bacterium]
MSRTRRSWVLVAGLLLGCRHAPIHSPQALRDAWLDALEHDDPRAAYALLGRDARAREPYPAFLARWRADASERAAVLAAARASKDDAIVQRSATAVHRNGVVVRWTKIGKHWLVVDGLPGAQHASTPAEAIRGFLHALARTDLASAEHFLADDLREAMHEDWARRAEAIEAALRVPGAVELSDDLSRAQLRYEPQRVLTLEQTPGGWTITALE